MTEKKLQRVQAKLEKKIQETTKVLEDLKTLVTATTTKKTATKKVTKKKTKKIGRPIKIA